jgi:hypothetical protein
MSRLEYARIGIGSGTATLTPLSQADIPAIIDFWYNGGADHAFLGIDPGLRGTGISSALYPHRMDTYFRLYPIGRLIHQTRTRNVAVNRMLDKYIPVAETRYIEKPDGVALPEEFHLRYVTAADIPGFFARISTPPPTPRTPAPPLSSSPADKRR